MSDYLNLKVEQLLTQTESLINERDLFEEEITKLKKVIEIYKEANEQVFDEADLCEWSWAMDITKSAQKAVEELLK